MFSSFSHYRKFRSTRTPRNVGPGARSLLRAHLPQVSAKFLKILQKLRLDCSTQSYSSQVGYETPTLVNKCRGFGSCADNLELRFANERIPLGHNAVPNMGTGLDYSRTGSCTRNRHVHGTCTHLRTERGHCDLILRSVIIGDTYDNRRVIVCAPNFEKPTEKTDENRA